MIKNIIFSTIALLLVAVIGTMALNSYAAADDTQASLSIVSGNAVREVNSPADRLSEDDVRVYEDKVIIQVKNPKWASFTDTNSMDPVIDAEANAIEIIPESEGDVQKGDIIAYKLDDGIIIHRVNNIGDDEDGWFCTLKGDNNPIEDPEKVRFDQITGVVVGILY